MEELISKKELLEKTNISYGQLYRWKRKKLIPEDWFIKKSTFTGQETYFPREKILDRIEKILSFKENMQLDELTEIFSPNKSIKFVSKEIIIQKEIISNSTITFFNNIYGETNTYNFEDVLCMYILDKTLITGNITRDEAISIIDIIKKNYKNIKGQQSKLILLRKMGVSFCYIINNCEKFFIEDIAKEILNISLDFYVEELKLKLM